MVHLSWAKQCGWKLETLVGVPTKIFLKQPGMRWHQSFTKKKGGGG